MVVCVQVFGVVECGAYVMRSGILSGACVVDMYDVILVLKCVVSSVVMSCGSVL